VSADSTDIEAEAGEIPPELIAALASGDRSTMLNIARLYGGPIPPPEMLESYDKTLPGLANRIATNWENEGNHRHGMERRAQLIGAGIVFVSLLVSPLLALAEAYLAAGLVPAAAIAAVASVSGLTWLIKRAGE
jgi:uncharacterized membrane protein